MSELYRLVYASKNLLKGSEAEMTASITQILAASQRNNAESDVTGALMFNAGAFAQVLEGPRREVEETFERIQCDDRHGDVTVLQCGPTEKRGFANWSMAFVGQSAGGQAQFSQLAAESGFDLSRLDGDAVFAMLHELVLDEEGVPPTIVAPIVVAPTVPATPDAADRPGAALDVERIRAELPQPGRALRAEHDAGPSQPAPPVRGGAEVPATKPDVVLHVLRTALARERQRTTDLRNEVDELRIALALQQAQATAIQGERDLWAKRAQLLATAMSQEAHAVPARSPDTPSRSAPAGSQDHPGASIKAVA